MKVWKFVQVFVAGLLLVSCKSRPPVEHGDFKQADLVELTKLDPSFHLEIRYATTNNFMHRPVYRQARAFLQRPAAEALVRVNRSLKAQGYALLIFDGYRPWSVTKAFYDFATPEQRKIGFVADPSQGSKHNRGCAVDLTLCDLATGAEITMPSTYDEFSERAYPSYEGGPAEYRKSRDFLRAAMEAEGFNVLKEEWWHFDYHDWPRYHILDIPFESIK